MPARDRLLAVFVGVLWGFNFVAIHLSLEHYPPFFLVALRFGVLAIPTVLFVKWPGVKVRWLLGYGVGFGILQFAFLYAGLNAGMPTGLASLVIQAGAPFTVVLAGILLREKITLVQGIGVLIAVAGLGVIAAERSGVSGLLPLILVLCGALGWAFANICARQANPTSPLGFTLWMSVVPPIPMLVLSLIFEGPAAIGDSVVSSFTLDALPAVVGLVFTVVFGTIVGTGIWSGLMKRNPSSRVAPFSMLVPVTAFIAAWLFLGEIPNVSDLIGGAVIVLGVVVATVAWRPRRPRRPSATEEEGPAAHTGDSTGLSSSVRP